MVTSSSPVLAAADIAKTLQFYKEVLGFDSTWTYGEPPTFGGASWGSVLVMFALQPDLAQRVEGHQLWLNVEDVDHLYAQHRERGAVIVSEIGDRPWNTREYTVRDPNGYHLRFAGNPSYTPRGVSGSAEGVTIERRLPTPEEFQRVSARAFYRDGVPDWVLENTWAAVVAAAPDGTAIGMARIMRDAPGWFSVWDVAVDPEWQNRRIGTEVMKAALDAVRDESPGAFVYLFTFKGGFYERLGFGKETLLMRKV